MNFPRVLPERTIGPFSVDGWSFISDRCGFLAIRDGSHSPASDGNTKAAREIIALPSAERPVALDSLRAFLEERSAVSDNDLPDECNVFGCPVDARVVKKWVDMIPSKSFCRGEKRTTRTNQRDDGGVLLLEGDDWKMVIAGLTGHSLKYPPTYDEPKKEVTA